MKLKIITVLALALALAASGAGTAGAATPPTYATEAQATAHLNTTRPPATFKYAQSWESEGLADQDITETTRAYIGGCVGVGTSVSGKYRSFNCAGGLYAITWLQVDTWSEPTTPSVPTRAPSSAYPRRPRRRPGRCRSPLEERAASGRPFATPRRRRAPPGSEASARRAPTPTVGSSAPAET